MCSFQVCFPSSGSKIIQFGKRRWIRSDDLIAKLVKLGKKSALKPLLVVEVVKSSLGIGIY